jgi:Tol biopolymer transport system component
MGADHGGGRTDAVVVADRSAPVPEPAVAGEQIVFLRSGSIWMMGPDGSEPTQLTVRADDAPDEAPAMSPDGTRVAFASGRGGVRRIYLLALADGNVAPLTDGASGGDGEPSWAPDGRRIAFVRGDPHIQQDLYMIDVTGGAPQLLLRGADDEPDRAGTPAWSPDGRKIALSSDRREAKGTALWLLEIDGKKLVRLTPIKQRAHHVTDLQPAWSPDGAWIAFASNRHVASTADAGDLDIYAIRADGSGLTMLTSDAGVAMHPAYSPDGKRLFFASTRDRANAFEWELYVMAATGGQQRRVTRDERPQNTAPSVGVTK